MKAYIDNKEIKSAYVGVDNKPHKIIKIYEGQGQNKPPKLVYIDGNINFQFIPFSNDAFNGFYQPTDINNPFNNSLSVAICPYENNLAIIATGVRDSNSSNYKYLNFKSAILNIGNQKRIELGESFGGNQEVYIHQNLARQPISKIFLCKDKYFALAFKNGYNVNDGAGYIVEEVNTFLQKKNPNFLRLNYRKSFYFDSFKSTNTFGLIEGTYPAKYGSCCIDYNNLNNNRDYAYDGNILTLSDIIEDKRLFVQETQILQSANNSSDLTKVATIPSSRYKQLTKINNNYILLGFDDSEGMHPVLRYSTQLEDGWKEVILPTVDNATIYPKQIEYFDNRYYIAAETASGKGIIYYATNLTGPWFYLTNQPNGDMYHFTLGDTEYLCILNLDGLHYISKPVK